MAQFTADIAWLLAVFSIAAGLVILHRATKDAKARLLKAAGWLLILSGLVTGSCTTYYWFKYQSNGAFDRAEIPALSSVDDQLTGTRQSPLHARAAESARLGAGLAPVRASRAPKQLKVG